MRSRSTRSRVVWAQAGWARHAGRSASTAFASPRACARSTSRTFARSFPLPDSPRASRTDRPRKTKTAKTIGMTMRARRMRRALWLTRLGEVVAGELEEALYRRLLSPDPLRHLARVVGGRAHEVLQAALRVVGQRVHAHDVLLGAGDAHRRAALGE